MSEEKLTMQIREVTISTGFERSVNINFNGWKFPASYHQKHIVANDEEADLIRRKAHLRCVRAVYSDLLNSYSVITVTAARNPGVMAQWELVKEEAEAGLQYALVQLEELSK